VNIDPKFPRRILLALGIVALIAAYPLLKFGSREVVIAAAAGALLSTINVLLGYAAIEYAHDKSDTTFMKAVLGGMAVRMALMLGTLLICIKLIGLHAVALTVSLLILYVIYLVLEVLFIQNKVAMRNQD
jgi:hypothetical protein